jgi:transketolase
VFATGRVYDQIRIDVAYSQANVKIFATHGGISVGKDGASHQMIEDLALMRVLPNMTVFAPSDAVQTRRIVELMAFTKGPMYARVGRANAPVLYTKEQLKDLQIGKGILLREGSDLTVIACGTMVDQAIEAHEKLAAVGISVRVVDMPTIKPLDERIILKCAKETNGIVTVEEHSIIGGLGSAVGEVLAEHTTRVPFKRIGVQDVFCESGEPDELFEKYGLSAPHIVRTAKALLKRKK